LVVKLDAGMSAGDLEIRPPRDDELDGLVALLVAQLREHGNELPDSELASAAAGMMRRPQRGQFLVARDSDVLVGFAALSFLWTLERGGLAAWLDELYVIPPRRAQGIGAALLRAATALAQAAGALAIDLEIESAHARAATLYERAGFTPLDRTRWALELTPSPPTAPAVRDVLGGCFCGALRYRIGAAAREVSHCHCTICRRTSGAPFVTWLTVPSAAFAFTSGTPAELHATPRAHRTFCAACGTALTFQLDAQPGIIDVTVGSLDDANAVAPDAHIWTSSQLRWLHIDDDLPRYAAAAPADA
jgi:GNAT superfamily N-acetyltransferase